MYDRRVVSGGDLRVPKYPVAVDLALVGRGIRRVSLFLAEYRAHTWHRQEVLDLLEQETRFLPAHDETADEWLCVRREAILYVRVPPPEGEMAEEELFEHRHAVKVRLHEGTELEGVILYTAPPEQARLIDFLNVPSRFFRLWRGEQVFLVQKAHLTEVAEIG